MFEFDRDLFSYCIMNDHQTNIYNLRQSRIRKRIIWRLSKRQTEFKSSVTYRWMDERCRCPSNGFVEEPFRTFDNLVLHTNREIHTRMLLGKPHTPSRKAIHSNRPCEWMCVNEFNICLAFKVVYKRFISRSIPGVWWSDSINNAREHKPQANTHEMTIKWINNSIAWVIA